MQAYGLRKYVIRDIVRRRWYDSEVSTPASFFPSRPSAEQRTAPGTSSKNAGLGFCNNDLSRYEYGAADAYVPTTTALVGVAV